MQRINCSKCEEYKKKEYYSCRSCWQNFPTETPNNNSLSPKKPYLGYFICRCETQNCYEHNLFCELCFTIDNNGSKHKGTYFCVDCYNYYANNITAPGSFIEKFNQRPSLKWYDP